MACPAKNCIKCNTPTEKCKLLNGVCPKCRAKS